MMVSSWGSLLAVGLACGVTSSALGQWGGEAPFERVAMDVDSGFIPDVSDHEHRAVFVQEVGVPEALWLRVHFGDVKLGPSSYIQITSLEDGDTQFLYAEQLEEWNYSSAVFNGDAVLVEVVSQGGGGVNHLTVVELSAGEALNAPASICFGVDDRVPSDDPRVGRMFPNGCTAWMINDCHRCMLTAGHCVGGFNLVQFNVPLSDPDGSWNFPPSSDQYPVDFSSLQSQSSGIGGDWGYFGCFANSSTGLTPGEAQDAAFDLIDPPNVTGQSIRITGYGTTGNGVPGAWNGAQKTHQGPFVFENDSQLQYQVDTTGGNSGSPVIIDGTNFAIGIHTHAGCGLGGGANNGTASTQNGLENALASPQGICCPGPFETPAGAFTLISPAFGEEDLDPDDVVLVWSGSEAAESYDVLIGTTPFFNDGAAVYAVQVGTTSHDVPEGVLDFDTAYFWRILANKGNAMPTQGTPEVMGFFTMPVPVDCPADLTGDGVIDALDLNVVLASFGSGDGGDITGDGVTDSADLNEVLSVFGESCD